MARKRTLAARNHMLGGAKHYSVAVAKAFIHIAEAKIRRSQCVKLIQSYPNGVACDKLE
jgi:hypothetical protein